MCTDGLFTNQTLHSVINQANNIDSGQHPNPLRLRLVPHKQFLDVLVDENVDSFS